MRRRLASWSFSIFVAAAAAAHANRLSSIEIADAQRLWASADLKSYSYTVVEGHAFGYTTYHVRVRDGQCAATSTVKLGPTRYPWKHVVCSGVTVSDLFSQLSRMLSVTNVDVHATFDHKFGFPISFQVEHSDIEDADFSVLITEFKVTGGKRT